MLITSQADMALTSDFSTLAEYKSGFEALTKLQHLRSKILPLSAQLTASMGIISGLTDINEEACSSESKSQSILHELRLLGNELQGYAWSIESLKSQSEDIFTLVSLVR